MSKNTKTVTIVSRAAPYRDMRPQLCLDIALASAVFEQTVNYIFLDDGVYQLLANQNADQINFKTLSKALETLDLYGIENVYVSRSALESRDINPGDLLLSSRIVNDVEIKELLAQSHCVFNL